MSEVTIRPEQPRDREAVRALNEVAFGREPEAKLVEATPGRRCLEECGALDVDGVVVLGHPEYYPRFGFVPEGRFGLGCEYDVPAGSLRPREAFLEPKRRDPSPRGHRVGPSVPA